MTTITEDSHFKIKAASVAIIVFFVASTIVSIGNSRINNVEAEVKSINTERAVNRQQLYKEVSDMRSEFNGRLMRIEALLEQQNKRR